MQLTNWCEFVALCRFTATIQARPAFQANGADGLMQIRLLRGGTWALLASQDYVASAAAFQPSEAISLVAEMWSRSSSYELVR